MCSGNIIPSHKGAIHMVPKLHLDGNSIYTLCLVYPRSRCTSHNETTHRGQLCPQVANHHCCQPVVANPTSPSIIIFLSKIFLYILFILYYMCLEMRKCEKIVENMFSISFLGMQPNTEKYFSEYFQEHNQTLENNLFFGKHFHLKIFYHQKIFPVK